MQCPPNLMESAVVRGARQHPGIRMASGNGLLLHTSGGRTSGKHWGLVQYPPYGAGISYIGRWAPAWELALSGSCSSEIRRQLRCCSLNNEHDETGRVRKVKTSINNGASHRRAYLIPALARYGVALYMLRKFVWSLSLLSSSEARPNTNCSRNTRSPQHPLCLSATPPPHLPPYKPNP